MDSTNITISGKIVRDIAAPRNVNNANVITLVIATHTGRDQKRETHYWEVDVWDELAVKMSERVKKGMFAVVAGTFDGLRPWQNGDKSGIVLKLRAHKTPGSILIPQASAPADAVQPAQPANGAQRTQPAPAAQRPNGNARPAPSARPNDRGAQRNGAPAARPATAAPAATTASPAAEGGGNGGFSWDGLDDDRVPF